MLLGCCHCGPLDSVSSVFASSHESLSNSSQSLDVGSGCFCIGSVSSNIWRMDIDYGWNATTGANAWCCALYRKQKSYILRRVSSANAICYWESDERSGRGDPGDALNCLIDTSKPRAWMAIHGPNQGYFGHRFFSNGWAISAGLAFTNGNNISAPNMVLPYVWADPNSTKPFQQADQPVNCLTAKTLTHYSEFLIPNQRRWFGASGSGGITAFPCGTGFGTWANDFAPYSITLTPVNA